MPSSLREGHNHIWMAGMALSMLPLVSFMLQYVMSVRQGIEFQLFQHFTVTYVDWLFVPFNYIVVRVIDWRRGLTIASVSFVSVVANIFAHAVWQYHGIYGGHMFSPEQAILPAGLVHLGFSIIEGALILAFVFARNPSAAFMTLATGLAITYFIGAGVSGFVMNNGFIITDVIMVTSGIFLLLLYPQLTCGRSRGKAIRCD